MNPFFRQTTADDRIERPRPPNWLIGKLAHVAIDPGAAAADADAEQPQWHGRWVFEVIGYDWLLQQGLLTGSESALEQRFALGQAPSPFATAPLYRLELEMQWPPLWSWGSAGTVPRWARALQPALGNGRPDAFGVLEPLAGVDAPWLQFRLDPPARGRRAELYANAFDPPSAVRVSIRLPRRIAQDALTTLYASIVANVQNADVPAVQALLSGSVATHLAVFDVGQGNANALLDDQLAPTLYYDVGAAISHNQHTRPAASALCFCRQPPIVLSHWDMDHWAGAGVAPVGAVPAAYSCTWLAPPLPASPMAVALAAEITGAAPASPSRLLAFPAGLTVMTTLPSGDQVCLARGSGSDSNSSGIVMTVRRTAADATTRSWLLTGDCDYGALPAGFAPQDAIGLVVPHHGAAGSGASVPSPQGQTYCRLAYSFGPGNHFGKVRHAVASCVQAHANAGWVHASWSPANVFDTHPGGDARITAAHAAGAQRGSILIGWQPYSQPTAHYACGCGVGVHFQL
ncbi:beta-lactamase superfamily II metal-dependent hydrolase [Xanthomonas translucens]